MEGISTILAMILIVIIVVALIGLTYTFASTLFTTTTTAATTTTTSITANMQKTIDIVAANCYNTTGTNFIINYTLRNSGTVQIAGQISATLDGADISATSYLAGTGTYVGNATLNPGQIQGYGYLGTQNTNKVITRTLTIITPAGSVNKPLANCPT